MYANIDGYRGGKLYQICSSYGTISNVTANVRKQFGLNFLKIFKEMPVLPPCLIMEVF